MTIDEISPEDFINIPPPSPRDTFMILLTNYYNIDNIRAIDIVETAVDLFKLDINGNIPIDWEELLKHQA